MATFNKVNDFVENMAHGVLNLSTNQLVVALSTLRPAQNRVRQRQAETVCWRT